MDAYFKSTNVYDAYQIPENSARTTEDYSLISQNVLSAGVSMATLTPEKKIFDRFSTPTTADITKWQEVSPENQPLQSEKLDEFTLKMTQKLDKKHASRRFKYDPTHALRGFGNKNSQFDTVLKYRGLAKRGLPFHPARKYMGLGKKKYDFDPALKYMGLGKRNSYSQPVEKPKSSDKKSLSFYPVMMFMGVKSKDNSCTHKFKPENQQLTVKDKEVINDNKFSMKYKNFKLGNDYFQVHELLPVNTKKPFTQMVKVPNLRNITGNSNHSSQISSNTQKTQYTSEYSPITTKVVKRGVKYDPALKYMGLGKRIFNYDPALTYMGLGKKSFKYASDLKSIGLGKKAFTYDPALKYMGLGKRDNYRRFSGKNSYDPALKYMGLGKRQYNNQGTLGKFTNYDPALKYMGLGKRQNYLTDLENISNYDPTSEYMNFWKRDRDTVTSGKNNYDPALRYMGLGKRYEQKKAGKRVLYYPGLRYVGLGKRKSDELSDKVISDDPLRQNISFGKKDRIIEIPEKITKYNPALKYIGLGKRNKDHEVLEKRNSYDPGLKYMGLGKRKYGYETEKSISTYHTALNNMNLQRRNIFDRESTDKISSYDPPSQDVVLEKRKYGTKFSSGVSSYDPAFKYMGLGKRKTTAYDPGLKYMGLGKRKTSNYDMGLGKRKIEGEERYQQEYHDNTDHSSFNGMTNEKKELLSRSIVKSDAQDLKYNTISPDQDLEDRSKTFYNQFAPSKETENEYAPAFNVFDLDKTEMKFPLTYPSYNLGDESDQINQTYDDATPDPKLVKKLVDYFDSLRLGAKNDARDFDETDYEETFPNVESPQTHGENALVKTVKIGEHAPKYIGYYRLQNNSNSDMKMCGKSCKSLLRRKRDANEDEAPEVRSQPDDDLLVQASDGNFRTFEMSPDTKKRDYDDRPKYNPGWIFIGLGKRSPLYGDGQHTQQTSKGFPIRVADYLLSKYHSFLFNLKNKLERLKLRLKQNKLQGLKIPFVSFLGNGMTGYSRANSFALSNEKDTLFKPPENRFKDLETPLTSIHGAEYLNPNYIYV